MRTFLISVLYPLPLLILFVIVAFLLYYHRHKKVSIVFGCIAILWFLAISTPIIPVTLLNALEQKNQPTSTEVMSKIDQPFNILVLGSGYQYQQSLSYSQMLNPSGLARLTEAIRLSRIMPKSTIVFSGYNGRQPIPQAEIGARAAEELGICPTKIQTIPEPWNTKDEARFYKEKYGASKTFILITDAAHMPRALYHFREAGLNPIPAPTNYRIRKNEIPKTFTYYLPSSQNIAYSEIIFHEYLGLIWAKLGGN